MMKCLFQLIHKNSKVLYYIHAFSLLLYPPILLRRRLRKELELINNSSEKDYILDRVNYYNKLENITPLPKDAPLLASHTYKNKKWASVYFFDTYEYTRYFSPTLCWSHKGGDVTDIPDVPTIVKSRPIAINDNINNTNSVLLKLNKIRHFIFVKDPIPFEQKKEIVLFRGAVHGKPKRQKFLETYISHPVCDLRDTAHNSTNPPKWKARPMSIREHLNYKYIMALEGNDVASNLKWIMSSNSVAVMPRPTYETWFMEGRLIPNYHYIEIKADYSDLIERITYYNNHPDEAMDIVKHANSFVAQFQNQRREKLISLLVLAKYFNMTGQN